MTKYIKILFAISFVAMFCSCDGDRTLSNFEAPQTQEELNKNTQLDKSVDVVPVYNDNSTETAKAAFYEDKTN
jgi:hypothetical protein